MGHKVGAYAPRELTIDAIVLAPGLSFVLPGVLNGATLITGSGDPVESCPLTDHRFFVRVPGRASPDWGNVWSLRSC